MLKSVSYSVVERKNLHKPTEPAKFYAQAQSSGTVDLDDMCERVQEKSSLTEADVVAVFRAIENEIVDSLLRGAIVRMGRVGTFQIGLESAGCATRKAFRAHLIESVHINYRPSAVLSSKLDKIDFRKVSRRGKNDVIDLEEDEKPEPEPTPIDPEA